jgi:hypothetical protein
MMSNPIEKKKRGSLKAFRIGACLTIGIFAFCSVLRGDITGRIQSVDGQTVRIVVEGGMLPEIGAKVKISDQVEGVGRVPLIGTWKVTAIEENVVVAVTEDTESGTPLPGYRATISGEGGGSGELLPDEETGVDEGPVRDEEQEMRDESPVIEREQSSEDERTPVKSGGGGGIIAKPRTTWPFVVGAGLAVAIIVLVLTIGALRKAGSGEKAKVKAVLDVFYADGGQKTFNIDKERTFIGRGEGNDLVLHDSGVSSRHAEIVASPKGFMLNDLGSANGTFLNEKEITAALIYAGDKIRVGSTTLSFRS